MSGLQTFLTSALTYLVAIGILVAVHEYGHFWAARRVGIKVLRYSLGFGRVLWRRMGRDGTEYALSAIPLGGYVRLLDERDGSVIDPRDLPHAFNRQPVWKRIFVLFAGPGANFLLAIFAFWVFLMLGEQSVKPLVGEVVPNSIAANAGLRDGDEIVAVSGRDTSTRTEVLNGLLDELIADGQVVLVVRDQHGSSPREVRLDLANRSRELTEPGALFKGLGFYFWFPEPSARISKVTPNGPAETAGLLAGDEIVFFDGERIQYFSQLSKLIETRVNKNVDVSVKRDGQVIDTKVLIGERTRDGKSVGMMGIERGGIGMADFPPSMLTIERKGPIDAIDDAIMKTWEATTRIVKMMGRLVTGDISPKNISGPIGIATVTGLVAQQGLAEFIGLLALISISVGVLNLLPVPVLDGGQIVYQLVELVKGGPVSERAQVVFQQVGIVLLILLTGLAFYNDIAQLS
jgi:regulator of sigma E protease